MNPLSNRVWLAAGLAGIAACMGAHDMRDPADTPDDKGALAIASAPACEKPVGRPPAGQAALDEQPYDGTVLVHYAATPGDAPCEAIDIAFRHRSQMLVGEPGSQVEFLWTADREMADQPKVTFLMGNDTVSLPAELTRRGTRVTVTLRASASLFAQHIAESRPTLLIETRRIELSRQQARVLRAFLDRAPRNAVARPTPASYPRRVAEDQPPPGRDPAWGSGWFCAEAQPGPNRKHWASTCHRTRAECEAERAEMKLATGRLTDCEEVASVECYRWRAGAEAGRSCFYRPSHCRRDAERRREDRNGAPTSGCYRSE